MFGSDSGSNDMGGTFHEGMLSNAKVCAEYKTRRNPETGEIEGKAVSFKGKMSLRIGREDHQLSINLHENLPKDIKFKDIFSHLMQKEAFHEHLEKAINTEKNLRTAAAIRHLKVSIGGRVTTVGDLWENYAKPLMKIRIVGVNGNVGDEDEDAEHADSGEPTRKYNEYED